jgi:hypothetical protein
MKGRMNGLEEIKSTRRFQRLFRLMAANLSAIPAGDLPPILLPLRAFRW